MHRDQLLESGLPFSNIQRAACMQASPGKIPIGARLTWLLKAYFTLYWPTSLHFLCCTHPSLFYFLLDSFTVPFHPHPLSCVSHEQTEKNSSALFFLLCWVIVAPHLSTYSPSYLNRHVALFESAPSRQQWGQSVTADVRLWDCYCRRDGGVNGVLQPFYAIWVQSHTLTNVHMPTRD